MHLCHNPTCTNPAHLALGTQKQNMAMASSAGRMPHKIPTSHMGEIMERRASGETLESIGKSYNCRKNTVSFYLKHRNS